MELGKKPLEGAPIFGAQPNAVVPPDTDLHHASPHHTLGRGPTQAAAGNHEHSLETVRVESTSVSWNSLIVPGRYKNLMHSISNPNGPSHVDHYYYVEVYRYNLSNITQVAIPYYLPAPVFIRQRYNGTWGAWTILGAKPSFTCLNFVKNSGFSAGFNNLDYASQEVMYPGFALSGAGFTVNKYGLYRLDISGAWSWSGDGATLFGAKMMYLTPGVVYQPSIYVDSVTNHTRRIVAIAANGTVNAGLVEERFAINTTITQMSAQVMVEAVI